MKAFAVLPVMSFLVFFLGVCIAALFYPGWDADVNTLSDLGRHENPMSSIFFNGGCWLSGIILAAGGVGKARSEEGSDRFAGIALAVAGFGLFALGFATGDYSEIHDMTTYVIFISAIAAMILATASDALRKDWFVVVSSIIILILMVIQGQFFHEGTEETMLIAGAALWSMVQIWKYGTKDDSS